MIKKSIYTLFILENHFSYKKLLTKLLENVLIFFIRNMYNFEKYTDFSDLSKILKLIGFVIDYN